MHNLGLSKTFEKDFDLYLFDVNVPFINGFELLQSLRENKDITPAIFITALIDIDNLTKGFKVGADDYIRKPFNANELIVRVDSLIKKSFKNYESTIKYNDLSYDIKEEKVYKENEEIHLSPSEHQLLVLFLKNIGKVINKDDILFIRKIDKVELNSAYRAGGSGGYFGYTGKFKNLEIGTFYMYATEFYNLQLIVTKDKKYMVSCAFDKFENE